MGLHERPCRNQHLGVSFRALQGPQLSRCLPSLGHGHELLDVDLPATTVPWVLLGELGDLGL
eukprot:2330512-Lingulodinium_polyedra.AAC.1